MKAVLWILAVMGLVSCFGPFSSLVEGAESPLAYPKSILGDHRGRSVDLPDPSGVKLPPGVSPFNSDPDHEWSELNQRGRRSPQVRVINPVLRIRKTTPPKIWV